MIHLDIESELDLAEKWTNEHTNQLQYSIAVAMNASAMGSRFLPGSKEKSALSSLKRVTEQRFDRPKRQTADGYFASPAKKNNLLINIKPKDEPWRRNRYLSGNIYAGERAPKKWEVALINHPLARNMPKGVVLQATRFWDAKRDKYGNITNNRLEKLYDSVGTTGRSGSNVFVGTPKGGSRPPGVYRRERSHKLRPLFRIKTSASYRSVIPAEFIVERDMQKSFGRYLRVELAKNVAKRAREGKADLRTGIF